MTEKKEKIRYFVYLHVLLFFYSLGGIFSKFAAGESFLSFKFILFYGIVVFNLFIYAVVWQQILKKMSLTAAYANKGITLIWSIVFGRIVFSEEITLTRIIGALIVIAGIIIVVTDDE